MLGGWLSYWTVPVFSAAVWLAMLLAMLIHWLTQGSPKYTSMQDTQTIAYISDVGASDFKPLFIAMGAVSVVTFDLVFIAEQYLRATGVLTKNSRGQKILAWLSIVFAVVGAAGLILLAIFDTLRHHVLHNVFLVLFIGGYVISAVFTTAEYQRLGIRHRDQRILRASFWIKLAFIIIEVALAIAFGTLNRVRNWNAAAIVEWIIALVYTFYVASFAVDFRPATGPYRSRHQGRATDEIAGNEISMAQAQHVAHDDGADRYGRHPGGAYYPSGTTNASVTNGYTNRVGNSTHKEAQGMF